MTARVLIPVSLLGFLLLAANWTSGPSGNLGSCSSLKQGQYPVLCYSDFSTDVEPTEALDTRNCSSVNVEMFSDTGGSDTTSLVQLYSCAAKESPSTTNCNTIGTALSDSNPRRLGITTLWLWYDVVSFATGSEPRLHVSCLEGKSGTISSTSGGTGSSAVAIIHACSDGIDNDSDGQTDFPNDPGCTSATDDSELGTAQCDDGIDNDSDGKIDFPADDGCDSLEDVTEASGGALANDALVDFNVKYGSTSGTPCESPCGNIFTHIADYASIPNESTSADNNPGINEDWVQPVCVWDFGDTESASTNWATGARSLELAAWKHSKNVDYGCTSGHRFVCDGSGDAAWNAGLSLCRYIVTSDVYLPGESGVKRTEQNYVYVQDQDDAYSGANTHCYDPLGSNMTGCPAGGTPHNAFGTDFDLALSNCGIATGRKRCLFLGGSAWNGDVATDFGETGGSVGRYGSGQVSLTMTGGSAAWTGVSATPVAQQRQLWENFDVLCSAAATMDTSFMNASTRSQQEMHIYNVSVDACGNSVWAWQAGAAPVQDQHTNWYIEDFSMQNAKDAGNDVINFYASIVNMVWLGGKAGDLNIGQHIIRTPIAQNVVLAHLTLGKIDSANGWGNTQNIMKLENTFNCDDAGVAHAGRDFGNLLTLRFSERILLHDNEIRSDPSATPYNKIGANHALSGECEATRAVRACNNIFRFTGKTGGIGTSKLMNNNTADSMVYCNNISDQRDGGPIASSVMFKFADDSGVEIFENDDIWIFNNSGIVSSGVAVGKGRDMVFLGNALVDTLLKSNAYYDPDGNHAFLNDEGSTNLTNLSNVISTSNIYLSVPTDPLSKATEFFPAAALEDAGTYDDRNPLDFFLRVRPSTNDDAGALCPEAGC